jgi:hypothetical protein
MRFVPMKTLEQQGCLVLHRTRHLLARQQNAHGLPTTQSSKPVSY